MKRQLWNVIFCGIMFFIIIGLSQCKNKTSDKVDKGNLELPAEKEIAYKKIHGFSTEKYIIDSSTVDSGESFGQILQQLGVSFSFINDLGNKFKVVYDIRRIYPGDKYYTLKDIDSSKISKLVYQHSSTELVVMNFEDSVDMYLIEKPVVIKLKRSGGEINSSLWQSFIKHQLTPALVSNVANLYAWTIDFFDIQPKDSYKIIYESKYVDGKFIGVGDILSLIHI